MQWESSTYLFENDSEYFDTKYYHFIFDSECIGEESIFVCTEINVTFN